MSDSRPIAVFDSGVGGLSVLKKLMEKLPNEKYIYFGDTARIPYGEKTKEQLISYAREILDWYENLNVKLALMACNTSSATSLEEVRPDYNFEIMGLIAPTANFIAENNFKKIGIMATSATVKSHAYKNAILKLNPNAEVFETACPGLVEFVENGEYKSKKVEETVKIFTEKLLEQGAEKIVLGCTHYPYLRETITRITGDILIDPAEFIVDSAKDYLEKNNLFNNELNVKNSFYVSSNPNIFEKTGKLFLEREINASLILTNSI
jgi:glutamate racemase